MKIINCHKFNFIGLFLLIFISLSATEDFNTKNDLEKPRHSFFVNYFQQIEKVVHKVLLENMGEKSSENSFSSLMLAAAWQINVNRIDFSPQASGTQILFRMQLQCAAVDENAAYHSEVRFPAQSPTYFQIPVTHPAIENFYYDSGTDEWVIDLQDVVFAGTSLEFDILAKSPNHTTPDGETFQIDATVTSDNTVDVSDVDSGAWTATANLGVEKYLQYGPDSDALLDAPVRYYLYPCDPSFVQNASGHLYLANWTLIDELPADVVYNNSSGTYDAGSHTVTWSDTEYLNNEDCAFGGASAYWIEVTFPSTIYGAAGMPPVLEAENVVTFEGYPLGEAVIPANRMFDTDTLLHGFGLPNPIGTHTKTATTPFAGSQDKTYAGEDADFFINIRTASAGTVPYYWKIIDPLPCLDYTPNAATQYESQLPSSPACSNPAYQPTDHINLYMDSRYVTIPDKAAFAVANPTIPLEYVGTDGSYDTLHVPHNITGTYNLEYEISWAEILNQIPSGVGIAKLIWDSESIGVFVGVTAENLKTAARMTLRGDVAEDTPSYPMLDAYRVRNYAYFYIDDGSTEDSLGYIQDDVLIIDPAPILRCQKSVSETGGLITLTVDSEGADFRDTDSLIITDLLPFGYSFNYEAQQYIQLGGTGSWSWSTSNGNTNGTPYSELDNISVRNYIDVEVIDDYNSTGRQLVRATFLKPPIASGWKGLNAFRFSFYLNQSPMNYSAVNSMEVFPTDPITVSELQCQKSFSSTPTAASSDDPNDLDGDGLTIGDAFCADTDNVVPPSSVVDLQSFKAVKGDATTATNFEPFPAVAGITVSGGSADFQINVKNTGSIGLENFVIYDILPHVGDVGLTETQVSVARGSQFDALFDGIDMSTLPTGTIIEYSESTTPCRDELTTGTTPFPTGCVNDWTTILPSPISDVKALRFTFPSDSLFEFIPGEAVAIEYAVTYPIGVLPDEVAWNSFAYAGDRMDDNSAILPTEPPKVGLAIPIVDLKVTKSVDKTSTFVGSPIEYTLLIDHEGAVTENGDYTLPAGTAKNIVLNDDFKTAGLKIVPGSISILHLTSGLTNGVTFDTTTGDITIPELGPNDAYNIIYSAYSDTEQSITNTLEILSHPGVDDADSTPGNGIVSEDDIDSATAAWVTPAISFKKLVETESGSGTYIEADATDGLTGVYTIGQPVNYRFIVENTGSTWLTDVTIEDNLTGFACDQTIGYMPIGDMQTIDCTWSYGFVEANDPYVNIATVTGTHTISGVIDTMSAVDSASIIVVPNCSVDILEIYADNCQASGSDYTADWNISIDAFNYFTNAISSQRNSNAVQTHTLTGTTDTLSIPGIPADGGKFDTIKVWFTTDIFCFDTYILARPTPCPPTLPAAAGEICANVQSSEIAGTVFEDWNYDGVMNQSDTIGVSGIKVYLYDCNGAAVDSTYTDINGNYEFTGLGGGPLVGQSIEAYRVEFVLPESISCWAQPTQAGTDNGTTVQFVEPGNCASLGIASPDDFCQADPTVFVPCYIAGDPLSADVAYDTLEALVTFPYSSNDNTKAGLTSIATPAELGATWGMAFQKSANHIFTSAIFKRHFGLGTIDGTNPTTGGIYAIDVSNINSPTVVKWLDVNTIGINTGADTRDGSAANSLGTTPVTPSYDYLAYEAVGKLGMGDIDIQGDSILWLVNLADRSLYGIKNINPAVTPTASDVIGPISLPVTGCGSGEADVRPWALEIYKGKVYVGAVCTGESSQDSLDLHAYIFEYDPNIGTMSTFFDFDLNYERGKAGVGDPPADIGDWRTWQLVANFPNNTRENMQPILSDIEFDADGSLIIGMMDRWGLQTQDIMYNPDPTATNTFQYPTYIAYGDVLRACYVNGNHVFEGGTGCDYPTLNSNETDGGGNDGNEFYNGDYGEDDVYLHETAFGALLYLPGKEEVMITQYDPFLAFNEGGIRTLNNTTGSLVNRYLIYDNNSVGVGAKGLGLGDLVGNCKFAPIEIGNYVWEDTNKDGIQDACESGIENVRIELYNISGDLIAFDTTDAKGQYYFSHSDSTDQHWIAATDSIAANTMYYISVGGGNFSGNKLSIGGAAYDLTVDSTNAGTNRYLIDSDGTIASSIDPDFDDKPYLKITTGNAGQVDHSFDFGFTPSTVDYPDYTDTCPNAPCHSISSDIYLGAGVSAEESLSSNAAADTDADDGVQIFPSLDATPGRVFRLPITMYNTTGNDAYLSVWVDWNNNGYFEDMDEVITPITYASVTYAGTFQEVITFSVPSSLNTQIVGLRFRFSTDTSLNANAPCGTGVCATNGEVEDYIISVDCKSGVCLPIISTIKRAEK